MISGLITWLLRGWLSRWALTAEGEVKAGWQWLTSSAVHFLSFALALSLLGNWVLLERGNRYRDRLQAIGAVQRTAAKAQAQVIHEPARKSAIIASNSNAQAPAYYDRVRHDAATHAVRLPRPASKVGRSDLPGADRAEPGVHGPDAAADLVCRPPVEDRQIVDAAARAAEMRQEALDLIAQGAAVASPDTPPATH